MQINKLLYSDPLGPTPDPKQTAYEVAVRQREFSEQIGPAFTRLQSELLTPIINRVIYILQKKGLIEKIVIDGKQIQVSYKSTLVAAQGQQDVDNFVKFYQLLQGVQGEEAAVVNIDPVKFPSWAAEKLGVDASVLNTKEQMKEFYESQSEKAQEIEMSMLEKGQGTPNQGQPPI